MVDPQIVGCRLVKVSPKDILRQLKLHPPLPLAHGAHGAHGAHASSQPFPRRGAASAQPCAAWGPPLGGVLSPAKNLGTFNGKNVDDDMC